MESRKLEHQNTLNASLSGNTAISSRGRGKGRGRGRVRRGRGWRSPVIGQEPKSHGESAVNRAKVTGCRGRHAGRLTSQPATRTTTGAKIRISEVAVKTEKKDSTTLTAAPALSDSDKAPIGTRRKRLNRRGLSTEIVPSLTDESTSSLTTIQATSSIGKQQAESNQSQDQCVKKRLRIRRGKTEIVTDSVKIAVKGKKRGGKLQSDNSVTVAGTVRQDPLSTSYDVVQTQEDLSHSGDKSSSVTEKSAKAIVQPEEETSQLCAYESQGKCSVQDGAALQHIEKPTSVSDAKPLETKSSHRDEERADPPLCDAKDPPVASQTTTKVTNTEEVEPISSQTNTAQSEPSRVTSNRVPSNTTPTASSTIPAIAKPAESLVDVIETADSSEEAVEVAEMVSILSPGDEVASGANRIAWADGECPTDEVLIRLFTVLFNVKRLNLNIPGLTLERSMEADETKEGNPLDLESLAPILSDIPTYKIEYINGNNRCLLERTNVPNPKGKPISLDKLSKCLGLLAKNTQKVFKWKLSDPHTLLNLERTALSSMDSLPGTGNAASGVSTHPMPNVASSHHTSPLSCVGADSQQGIESQARLILHRPLTQAAGHGLPTSLTPLPGPRSSVLTSQPQGAPSQDVSIESTQLPGAHLPSSTMTAATGSMPSIRSGQLQGRTMSDLVASVSNTKEPLKDEPGTSNVESVIEVLCDIALQTPEPNQGTKHCITGIVEPDSSSNRLNQDATVDIEKEDVETPLSLTPVQSEVPVVESPAIDPIEKGTLCKEVRSEVVLPKDPNVTEKTEPVTHMACSEGNIKDSESKSQRNTDDIIDSAEESANTEETQVVQHQKPEKLHEEPESLPRVACRIVRQRYSSDSACSGSSSGEERKRHPFAIQGVESKRRRRSTEQRQTSVNDEYVKEPEKEVQIPQLDDLSMTVTPHPPAPHQPFTINQSNETDSMAMLEPEDHLSDAFKIAAVINPDCNVEVDTTARKQGSPQNEREEELVLVKGDVPLTIGADETRACHTRSSMVEEPFTSQPALVKGKQGRKKKLTRGGIKKAKPKDDDPGMNSDGQESTITSIVDQDVSGTESKVAPQPAIVNDSSSGEWKATLASTGLQVSVTMSIAEKIKTNTRNHGKKTLPPKLLPEVQVEDLPSPHPPSSPGLKVSGVATLEKCLGKFVKQGAVTIFMADTRTSDVSIHQKIVSSDKLHQLKISLIPLESQLKSMPKTWARLRKGQQCSYKKLVAKGLVSPIDSLVDGLTTTQLSESGATVQSGPPATGTASRHQHTCVTEPEGQAADVQEGTPDKPPSMKKVKDKQKDKHDGQASSGASQVCSEKPESPSPDPSAACGLVMTDGPIDVGQQVKDQKTSEATDDKGSAADKPAHANTKCCKMRAKPGKSLLEKVQVVTTATMKELCRDVNVGKSSIKEEKLKYQTQHTARSKVNMESCDSENTGIEETHKSGSEERKSHKEMTSELKKSEGKTKENSDKSNVPEKSTDDAQDSEMGFIKKETSEKQRIEEGKEKGQHEDMSKRREVEQIEASSKQEKVVKKKRRTSTSEIHEEMKGRTKVARNHKTENKEKGKKETPLSKGGKSIQSAHTDKIINKKDCPKEFDLNASLFKPKSLVKKGKEDKQNKTSTSNNSDKTYEKDLKRRKSLGNLKPSKVPKQDVKNPLVKPISPPRVNSGPLPSTASPMRKASFESMVSYSDRSLERMMEGKHALPPVVFPPLRRSSVSSPSPPHLEGSLSSLPKPELLESHSIGALKPKKTQTLLEKGGENTETQTVEEKGCKSSEDDLLHHDEFMERLDELLNEGSGKPQGTEGQCSSPNLTVGHQTDSHDHTVQAELAKTPPPIEKKTAIDEVVANSMPVDKLDKKPGKELEAEAAVTKERYSLGGKLKKDVPDADACKTGNASLVSQPVKENLLEEEGQNPEISTGSGERLSSLKCTVMQELEEGEIVEDDNLPAAYRVVIQESNPDKKKRKRKASLPDLKGSFKEGLPAKSAFSPLTKRIQAAVRKLKTTEEAKKFASSGKPLVEQTIKAKQSLSRLSSDNLDSRLSSEQSLPRVDNIESASQCTSLMPESTKITLSNAEKTYQKTPGTLADDSTQEISDATKLKTIQIGSKSCTVKRKAIAEKEIDMFKVSPAKETSASGKKELFGRFLGNQLSALDDEFIIHAEDPEDDDTLSLFAPSEASFLQDEEIEHPEKKRDGLIEKPKPVKTTSGVGVFTSTDTSRAFSTPLAKPPLVPRVTRLASTHMPRLLPQGHRVAQSIAIKIPKGAQLTATAHAKNILPAASAAAAAALNIKPLMNRPNSSDSRVESLPPPPPPPPPTQTKEVQDLIEIIESVKRRKSETESPSKKVEQENIADVEKVFKALLKGEHFEELAEQFVAVVTDKVIPAQSICKPITEALANLGTISYKHFDGFVAALLKKHGNEMKTHVVWRRVASIGASLLYAGAKHKATKSRIGFAYHVLKWMCKERLPFVNLGTDKHLPQHTVLCLAVSIAIQNQDFTLAVQLLDDHKWMAPATDDQLEVSARERRLLNMKALVEHYRDVKDDTGYKTLNKISISLIRTYNEDQDVCPDVFPKHDLVGLVVGTLVRLKENCQYGRLYRLSLRLQHPQTVEQLTLPAANRQKIIHLLHEKGQSERSWMKCAGKLALGETKGPAALYPRQSAIVNVESTHLNVCYTMPDVDMACLIHGFMDHVLDAIIQKNKESLGGINMARYQVRVQIVHPEPHQAVLDDSAPHSTQIANQRLRAVFRDRLKIRWTDDDLEWFVLDCTNYLQTLYNERKEETDAASSTSHTSGEGATSVAITGKSPSGVWLGTPEIDDVFGDSPNAYWVGGGDDDKETVTAVAPSDPRRPNLGKDQQLMPPPQLPPSQPQAVGILRPPFPSALGRGATDSFKTEINTMNQACVRFKVNPTLMGRSKNILTSGRGGALAIYRAEAKALHRGHARSQAKSKGRGGRVKRRGRGSLHRKFVQDAEKGQSPDNRNNCGRGKKRSGSTPEPSKKKIICLDTESDTQPTLSDQQLSSAHAVLQSGERVPDYPSPLPPPPLPPRILVQQKAPDTLTKALDASINDQGGHSPSSQSSGGTSRNQSPMDANRAMCSHHRNNRATDASASNCSVKSGHSETNTGSHSSVDDVYQHHTSRQLASDDEHQSTRVRSPEESPDRYHHNEYLHRRDHHSGRGRYRSPSPQNRSHTLFSQSRRSPSPQNKGRASSTESGDSMSTTLSKGIGEQKKFPIDTRFQQTQYPRGDDSSHHYQQRGHGRSQEDRYHHSPSENYIDDQHYHREGGNDYRQDDGSRSQVPWRQRLHSSMEHREEGDRYGGQTNRRARSPQRRSIHRYPEEYDNQMDHSSNLGGTREEYGIRDGRAGSHSEHENQRIEHYPQRSIHWDERYDSPDHEERLHRESWRYPHRRDSQRDARMEFSRPFSNVDREGSSDRDESHPFFHDKRPGTSRKPWDNKEESYRFSNEDREELHSFQRDSFAQSSNRYDQSDRPVRGSTQKQRGADRRDAKRHGMNWRGKKRGWDRSSREGFVSWHEEARKIEREDRVGPYQPRKHNRYKDCEYPGGVNPENKDVISEQWAEQWAKLDRQTTTQGAGLYQNPD